MIESMLRNSVSRALCDRVSVQKLSESSIVSDRLILLPGHVRGENVLYLTGVHVLDIVLLFVTLCSKSSGSERLTVSELYNMNN